MIGIACLHAMLSWSHLPPDLPTKESVKRVRVVASWYDTGTHNANGSRFDPNGLSAAHRTLKFGTKLRITRGLRSVVVTVLDRGPFVHGRSLDLSRGAAARLGMIVAGTTTVEMEVING